MSSLKSSANKATESVNRELNKLSYWILSDGIKKAVNKRIDGLKKS